MLKENKLTQTRKETQTFSGAEIVIKCLLDEGVDTIFGYPGGAIMPVYDALYDYRSQLTHHLGRHEQGCIHSAQGYARASHKVGVCLATSGPGATNLLTGIADAMIDSTPLVCITGQVASHLLGTDAFQETDVVGVSSPITKWNAQVTKAKDIVPTLAKAFFLARSGRPGPVLVDITKDAQFEMAEYLYEECKSVRSYHLGCTAEESSVYQAAELINQAKKPFLLVGQGVLQAKAEVEVAAFLQKTGIPVASTLLGLSAVPTDHPQYTGMLGMHGNYAPNMMTNECDVLIAVGMRFDDRVTGDVSRYAKQAKVIHLEKDPSELNKIIPADVALLGDAKDSLQQLLPLLQQKKHLSWLEEFNQLKDKESEKVIVDDLFPSKEGLTMPEVIECVNHETENNALFVTDVGQHQMYTARYAKYCQSNSSITSGGLGTMGFALPAAIGAKLGAPEREVVAVIGDGGFQMTLQELGTIMQSEVDVKIVILNNSFLGMVRQWQEMFFEKRYSFTDIQSPDFVALAASYGVKGQKVNSREEMKEGVKEMLNHKGAYLLEVTVEQEENVFPMIPTGAAVNEVKLSK